MTSCEFNSFLVIIRLIHDERSGVCDHEMTHKSYSLLWLHMVGGMKDDGHIFFGQLICSEKDL